MRSINLVSICLLTASMVGCGLSSSVIPTVDNVEDTSDAGNDAAVDASDDVAHVFTNDASDDVVVVSDDASDSMVPPCDGGHPVDVDDASDAQDEEPVVKKVHLDAGDVDASDGGAPVKDSGGEVDSATAHDSGNGEDVSTKDASPDASECYTVCEHTCQTCTVSCQEDHFSCQSDRDDCTVKCTEGKTVCYQVCDRDCH